MKMKGCDSMKTASALAVKFGATFVAVVVAGYFVGVVNWGLFFWIAVIGTVVNYIVGDLLVLRAGGNIVASIGDGGMAGLIAYFMAVTNQDFIANEALSFAVIFGLIVAAVEFFFHKWIAAEKEVAPNTK